MKKVFAAAALCTGVTGKKVKVTQTRQARFSCRVCAEKAYGRYFAREEKSSGRGASNIRFLPSKGCSRKSFQA